jgi:hypothetical protein
VDYLQKHYLLYCPVRWQGGCLAALGEAQETGAMGAMEETDAMAGIVAAVMTVGAMIRNGDGMNVERGAMAANHLHHQSHRFRQMATMGATVGGVVASVECAVLAGWLLARHYSGLQA